MAQATVSPTHGQPEPELAPVSAPGGPTSVDLAIALFDVVRLSRRTRRTDAIEPAAVVVLASADRLRPARPSDIACELRLDLSTVSRHLSRLEDEGYLCRIEDAEDRRTRRVETTDSGRAVLLDVLTNRASAIDDALHRWNQADRRALTDLLQRLATDLESAR